MTGVFTSARSSRIARALVLALFAGGPLVAATVHASTGTRYTAQDGSYDDTTTGAIAHPEVAFGVGSAPMQQAIALAKAHWGTDPCGGQVTIVWDSLAPDINAQSSWTNPRSAYDNPDLNSDCKVTFNPVASFDWAKFCTVTVHEFGHLSGRPHVPDSNDVMSAYYTKPVPECTANTPAQFQPAPSSASAPPAQTASVPRPVAAKAVATPKKAAVAKKAPKKKKVVRRKRRSGDHTRSRRAHRRTAHKR